MSRTSILLIILLTSLPLFAQHNPSEVLSLGWTYYNNGRYEEALSTSESVLKQSGLTEKMKTNVNYFQGFVYAKLRRFGEAQACFRAARQGFEKHGPAAFATLSEIGLAKALIDEEKYEEAKTILNKVPADALSGSNKAYEYFVWSRLCFYRDEYAQGVDYAQKSLDEYRKEGSPADLLNATSELGMLQLLLGFLKSQSLDQDQRDMLIQEGLANSESAVASALDLRDLNKIHYSMINLVFYEHCKGIRSSKKELIEYYINRTKDAELKQLLEKIERLAAGHRK